MIKIDTDRHTGPQEFIWEHRKIVIAAILASAGIGILEKETIKGALIATRPHLERMKKRIRLWRSLS